MTRQTELLAYSTREGRGFMEWVRWRAFEPNVPAGTFKVPKVDRREVEKAVDEITRKRE